MSGVLAAQRWNLLSASRRFRNSRHRQRQSEGAGCWSGQVLGSASIDQAAERPIFSGMKRSDCARTNRTRLSRPEQ